MRRIGVIVAAVVAVAAVVWVWRVWWVSDAQQITRRLEAFESDFNESATEGLSAVARAAKLGSYFADGIVVDLGRGTPPIQGRETLIGMAARLQPRTAAFTLDLLDINVEMGPQSTAEVNLTAAFRRRSTSGEDSIDARELLLTMTKIDGEWRANHVKAIEPFR
jgi:hypothetical protein